MKQKTKEELQKIVDEKEEAFNKIAKKIANYQEELKKAWKEFKQVIEEKRAQEKIS